MTTRILSILSLALAASLCSGAAFAEGKKKEWNENHPRRHQVNKRLKNQHERVKEGEKEGELTKGEAKKINKEDRHIRHEEHEMAEKDGGHITKADQRKLNRQENRVSREIKKDEAGKAPESAPAAAPAPTPAAGQ